MYCIPLLSLSLLYLVIHCLCNSRHCTEGTCANSTVTWPSSASAVVALLVVSMCVETGAFIAVCILCYKKEYVVKKIRVCLQYFRQTRECCAPDNPCIACTGQPSTAPNTNTRSRFVHTSQLQKIHNLQTFRQPLVNFISDITDEGSRRLPKHPNIVNLCLVRVNLNHVRLQPLRTVQNANTITFTVKY